MIMKFATYNFHNAIFRMKKILKGKAVSITENLRENRIIQKTFTVLKTFGDNLGEFYIMMQRIGTRLRYLLIKSYSDG